MDWELVARNYGNDWQNTFPNAETIEEVNAGISNYQYYEKSLDNEKFFSDFQLTLLVRLVMLKLFHDFFNKQHSVQRWMI